MKTREELIQDYLEQILTDEEQSQFDALLENDPDFRAELQLQSELHAILKNRLNRDDSGLREKLTLAEHAQRKGPGRMRWIPLLAAACVLIFGVLFFFPLQNSVYTLPEMRSEIVRGDLSQEGQTYEGAVKAFNDGDFTKSSAILSELQQANPNIVQYQYYHALSLIGERKFKAAAHHLTPLADGKSVFKDEAQYYLGVALYEDGQTEDAKRRLKGISSEAVIYNDAQKLFKAIE